MANSYQRATSDGTMSFLDISIDYLDRAEISVFFDDIITVEGVDWNWSGVDDRRVLFPTDVPNGVEVMIKRVTDSGALRHEFSTGAAFTAATLDEDLKQSLHIAQEAQEGTLVGDYFTDINMHGFRVYNVGTAVDDTDALTLGQYKADADGANAARIAAEAAADAAEASVAGMVPRVELADTTDLAKGAGMVGFLYSLVYAGNTVGAWLKDLATSAGASFIGFLQQNGVLRTLQSKGSDSIHLNDYLTTAQRADVAAGTLTLGCSTAFSTALANLPATGGTLVLPRGKILLNTAITISGFGHYRIVGEGFSEATNNTGATELIKAADISTAVLNVTAPGTRLEHLVIRGAVGNTGDGVQVSANSFSMENVLVCSMGQDGVRIGLDSGTNANSWHLVNCRFFHNGRDGLAVSDKVSPTLPDASAGTWLNCVAQSNTRDGVRVGNATLNTFLGGVVELNGGVGMRLNGAGANFNTVLGMDFDDGNTAGKMRIETGAAYNRVESATLYDTEIVDNGTLSKLELPNSSNAGWYNKGVFRMQLGNSGGASDIITGGAGGYTRITYGGDAVSDATAQVIVASNGLHLGKSTGGLVGFFDATPVAKATTAGAPSGTVANSGTPVNLATTFDGYTLQQIVKALRNYGLLN